MKNIIIIGIGRAGKTTLSQMIKRKYANFNLIHSDCIKWGIIRGEEKEEYYNANIDKQKEYEHSETFQRVLLEIFKSSVRNDIDRDGYIMESGQLEPKIISEMIDISNTIVICLGHGNLKKDEIINLCRTNDTPKDWSYNTSESELQYHAEKWSEMNIMLKKECPKYNIKYFDTSKNRKKILNQIMLEISDEIESD